MRQFDTFDWAGALRKAVVAACLFVYVAAGLYTEFRLAGWKPIPSGILEDFRYYLRALSDALAGNDPYAIRSIGSGFLYPPPALLVVELLSPIKSSGLQVSVFVTVNLALLALIVKGIATHYRYSLDRVWYWFVLCFGFAPFLELLHVGQINVLTMFGIFLLFVWEFTFPVLAGIGLSLAIVTKVTPVFFFVYLLVNKRWRILAAALIATSAWFVLGVLRFGLSPLLTYPDVFAGLLSQFPLDVNSQSFVAKIAIADLPQFEGVLSSLPSALRQTIQTISVFAASSPQIVQRGLALYLLVLVGLSALASILDRKHREPLFIVTALAMTLSANILWYHHYVFVLLPLLIWMGWRRLSSPVVIWCFAGLLIIQLDRYLPPYGLLIHLWSHISILSIVLWQWYTLYAGRRRLGAPGAAAKQLA